MNDEKIKKGLLTGFDILKYKKVFLTVFSIVVIFMIAAVSIFGFNLSIDFKGGSVYEIEYKGNAPTMNEINSAIGNAGISESTVQLVGQDSFIIKTKELTDKFKEKLDKELTIGNQYSFDQESLKMIGPSISSELAKKAFFAIIFVIVVIIFFIAYVFRKVSKPVSSFKYGLVAIIALIHDVMVPTGIFAIMGHFFVNYQIDVLFVTALLAVLGYSVNDTIVVFDRVRENLRKAKENKEKTTGEFFEKIVGKSLKQTIKRSVNTSMTTLLVLLSLFILGSGSTKAFTLVLMIGVLAGTYSSIFIASPLLVYLERFQKEKVTKVDKEK